MKTITLGASILALAAALNAQTITAGDDTINLCYTVYNSQPADPSKPIPAGTTLLYVAYTAANPANTLFRITINYEADPDSYSTVHILTAYDDFAVNGKVQDPNQPNQGVWISLPVANAHVSMIQIVAFGSGARATSINPAPAAVVN